MGEDAGGAKVVVAVDFGTSFSGFTYATTSAAQAGAKSYCKTPTSLLYAPCRHMDGGLHYQLKDWGWSALHAISSSSGLSHGWDNKLLNISKTLLSHLCSRPGTQYVGNEFLDVLSMPCKEATILVTRFKLCLAPDADNRALKRQLPKDITVERMIVDYLRCLSDYIMSQLQVVLGGPHLAMTDVQWCLTVPGIWEERAKQFMSMCAEKAGMVKGAHFPRKPTASPYPLHIILEPEAASVLCQQRATRVSMKEEDKFLVADVGGGTIDVVVHKKADTNKDSLRVHEVVANYGEVGGGTFVDSHFFHFVSQRIGCFKQFCRKNPSIGMNIYEWWQGIKEVFDGGSSYSADMPLPKKLSDAWKQHDTLLGIRRQRKQDYYKALKLKDTDIMRIFDLEVQKVVNLILRHIRHVRIVMVVGGFAASPYVRKMLHRKLEGIVEELIVAEEPGSVICYGALELHMKKDTIQSRISKQTYVIDYGPEVYVTDPRRRDGRCGNNHYDIFVRAGERVPMDASFTRTLHLRYPGWERRVAIKLFSSWKVKLEFAADELYEGAFHVDTREGMKQHRCKDVEVTLVFGDAYICASAIRVSSANPYMKQGPTCLPFHRKAVRLLPSPDPRYPLNLACLSDFLGVI